MTQVASDVGDSGITTVSTERTSRRIEVTEMETEAVTRYVKRNVGTDQVSIERYGTRTYLRIGE